MSLREASLQTLDATRRLEKIVNQLNRSLQSIDMIAASVDFMRIEQPTFPPDSEPQFHILETFKGERSDL